jgi:uncharacterized membrane protein
MYLSKALQEKFYQTVYLLQYSYAILFVFLGVDRIMNFTDIEWAAYISSPLKHFSEGYASVAQVLLVLGIIHIVIGVGLVLPYVRRLSAYIGLILLVVMTADAFFAGTFYLFALLHLVMLVGLFAYTSLLDVSEGLHEQ